MEIEQALPLVLDRFVHPSSFGERERAMLDLLYVQQAGKPNGVFLGPKRIAELTGRNAQQSKYDTKALQALRARGVVRRVRGSGRTSNTWSLAELRYWRVTWIGRRDQVLAFISGLQQGDVLSYRGDSLTELVTYRGGRPRQITHLRGVVSVNDRPATESDRPATELDKRESPLPSPRYAAADADTDTVLMGSSFSEGETNSSSCQEEEEGLARLSRAIARKIGKTDLWVGSRPRNQVAMTLRRHPGRLEQLLDLVARIGDEVKGPEQAAATLDALAEEAAMAGWPVWIATAGSCARCGGRGHYFDADGDRWFCDHQEEAAG